MRGHLQQTVRSQGTVLPLMKGLLQIQSDLNKVQDDLSWKVSSNRQSDLKV